MQCAVRTHEALKIDSIAKHYKKKSNTLHERLRVDHMKNDNAPIFRGQLRGPNCSKQHGGCLISRPGDSGVGTAKE